MLGSKSAPSRSEFQSCRDQRRNSLGSRRDRRRWSHKTGHGHSYARPLSPGRKRAARIYAYQLAAAGRLTEADARIYCDGLSASHNSVTGLCFPSYARIGELARVKSKTTVSDGLSTLEGVGLIRVTQRRHETRDYQTREGKISRGRPKTSNGYELVPVDELQASAKAEASTVPENSGLVAAVSAAVSASAPEGASLPSYLLKWEADNGRPYPGREKLLAQLSAARSAREAR